MRPEEDPEEGLTAKDPTANISIEDHVLHGSKFNADSQYISCCETLSAARLFASKSRNMTRIVKIEIDKNTPGIIDIIPLSDFEIEWTDYKGRNFANKFQEVLVVGHIPKECVTLLSN